jgi:4-carboxymuconolactone decarboxylase
MAERTRPTAPRIAPVGPDEVGPDGALLAPPGTLNVLATFAHHPDLARRWGVFSNHVLFKSSLPARERELAITRTGWLCLAEYEVEHHAELSRRAGITDEELTALTRPIDTHPWSEGDRALLSAVDELHHDQCVTDATWAALSAHLDVHQLLDLVFAVGQYTFVSMVLNSCGVQLESDFAPRLGLSTRDGAPATMLGASASDHRLPTPRTRPATARLAPLGDDALDDETRLRVVPGALNIFRTLAHHPKLMKRWMVFGSHVLSKSSLPPRERELAILRVGWLCRAQYEFGQHTVIGLRCDVTAAEIRALTKPLDAHDWSPHDRVLLEAVDELHADQVVRDETWAQLVATWTTPQVLDLLAAVGQYTLVSMALNTCGVELDEGIPAFPV